MSHVSECTLESTYPVRLRTSAYILYKYIKYYVSFPFRRRIYIHTHAHPYVYNFFLLSPSAVALDEAKVRGKKLHR